MRNTLAKGKACMQFLLQPAPFMSIENSKEEWKQTGAPLFEGSDDRDSSARI